MAFIVDHLLNTNSPPSQVQRNDLQNLILQLDEAILSTDEDISGINERILAMQAKILVLQTRRTQLVQQRSHYSSLLSPVRCLPIEIFGKIFVYATRDFPRHVLNLSAVCQLWRYAAFSTPMLWSTLELGHHTTGRNMDNHIDSWIERARSYPLSLVIRIKRDSFLDSSNSAITVITNHQWKSITLDSGCREISSILGLGELEVSNLEMLESFSLATGVHSTPELSLPDALRYAPRLKTLSLCTWQLVTFDRLPFPWRQLTSLTIAFRAWVNKNLAANILQACANIEEFIMDGKGDHKSGSNDLITLKYLRKLHTHCANNTFLLSLDTPSIQDLAIEASGLRYSYDDGIYEYIEKNGSTLLKLSIAPSDNRFVENIPYLRSLVELKLSDYNLDDDGSTMMCEVLISLVVNPEMNPSTIPLPRLEALKITCQATEWIQRVFMKVIDSRWWSDEEENARRKRGQRSLSRIKRSVLMNYRKWKVFCREGVDVLRAQGMSIEYLPIEDVDDRDTKKY